MQYTALSFSQPFSRGVLPRLLSPRAPTSPLTGVYAPASSLRPDYAEPIVARIYQPLFSAAASYFTRLRLLQQGNMQLYVAYIMVAVVAALAWATLGAGVGR
jgi:hypothetical protein